MTPDADDRKLGLADAYAVRTPDDNRALYRDWAATYERDFTEARGYVYHLEVARLFASAAPAPVDGPVLDVGCGTGIVGVALRELGIETIDGIDISPEMLAEAAQKHTYRSLTEADLTRALAIADDTYAGITSVGTFTHGHLGPEPLRELVRVTSPRGLFAIGINAEHYASEGFEALLSELAGTGAITEPVLHDVRIYEAADDEWADDLASVAVFRRR